MSDDPIEFLRLWEGVGQGVELDPDELDADAVMQRLIEAKVSQAVDEAQGP